MEILHVLIYKFLPIREKIFDDHVFFGPIAIIIFTFGSSAAYRASDFVRKDLTDALRNLTVRRALHRQITGALDRVNCVN
jgi:hypothetical protein